MHSNLSFFTMNGIAFLGIAIMMMAAHYMEKGDG